MTTLEHTDPHHLIYDDGGCGFEFDDDHGRSCTRPDDLAPCLVCPMQGPQS